MNLVDLKASPQNDMAESDWDPMISIQDPPQVPGAPKQVHQAHLKVCKFNYINGLTVVSLVFLQVHQGSAWARRFTRRPSESNAWTTRNLLWHK